jgi:hypothetical protein
LRDLVITNLSSKLDVTIVTELIDTYEAILGAHRRGDWSECLKASGRFVEHLLRAVELVRTGKVPSEIKSPAKTVEIIEATTSLPEPLRLVVPRVAYGAMYTLRSKRDAVHVKEIDPQPVDAALCVQTASWAIAELLRIFHTSDARVISETMAALTRGSLSYVETIQQEDIVTATVTCEVELLLLLSKWKETGATRSSLGKSSKFSAPTVSKALSRLQQKKLVHRTIDGTFHITGTGESELAREVTNLI